jgi:hypothetical protein
MRETRTTWSLLRYFLYLSSLAVFWRGGTP